MTTPAKLPIFPLGTVLFPGGRLPLRIFEARYMDMTRECMRSGGAFGVCLIREGREVGSPAVPFETGCTATIGDWDMPQLGVLNIMAHGGSRFRLRSATPNGQGLLIGEVEVLPDPGPEPVPAESGGCARVLRAIVEKHGAEVLPEPHRFDDADWVSWRLSELLPLPPAARQRLLEIDDPLDRLAVLQKLITPASG